MSRIGFTGRGKHFRFQTETVPPRPTPLCRGSIGRRVGCARRYAPVMHRRYSRERVAWATLVLAATPGCRDGRLAATRTSVLFYCRDNHSPTIHFPTIPTEHPCSILYRTVPPQIGRAEHRCSIFPPRCSTRQIQTEQNGTLWNRSHEKDGLGALLRPPSASGLNSRRPRRTIPPCARDRPAPGCSCS